jgi:hypothetical protein
MPLSFLTPALFDTLVLVIVLIGGALALVRLYRDLGRPPPPPGAAPCDDVRLENEPPSSLP